MTTALPSYTTSRDVTCAAGHNAIRASQVPIDSSHSKCTAPVGFPDPAVSTGFVHQLCPPFPTSSAIARLVLFYAMIGCLYRSPPVINAQTIRAVLLASATAATLVVRRAISCTSHGRLVPFRSA